ncbi:MAG TPA: hypothetical protein VF618_01800 [Thermoanaerobaculia bacterium]
MKGCARGCILWVLGWGAAAGSFYYYFVSLRDFGPPMYWASAVAGLLVVAAIGYALGIGTAYRERRLLLDAMAGTPPVDGEWAAVSGAIHATTPLTAPFSGQKVVAYEYKVDRHERHGRTSSQVVYFDGKALVPSSITTRHGSVRILCVPAFTDVTAESLDSSHAVKRAQAYLAATEFAHYETSEKRRTRLDEEWTDADGNFRADWQYNTAQIDLTDNFRLEEKHIKQNEQVCAFGLYSRDRGGLIPHPNWAKHTRLMRGDPSKVAAQLRSRMIRYAVGVVVCSALVYGIVWWYGAEAGA